MTILMGLTVSLTASPALHRVDDTEKLSLPENLSNAKPPSHSRRFSEAHQVDRNFLTPATENKTVEFKKKSSLTLNDNPTERSAMEGRLAELSIMGGGFLKQSQSGKALGALSSSVIASQLNAAAQETLNRYGTFEVNLNADERFSFWNSSFDMLVPLYDTQNHIIFTQAGIRRFDERTQTNLGLGFRIYRPEWFYGSNIFLDRDLSQKHLRGSIGLEAGMDYFKGNINRYQRLSGWRDTDENLDMESRPASGWDLTTQGWLPSYPQLGAMVKYEKYHGKKVAIHSRSQLERNPAALTAGLSWTPIPLTTLNVQRRHNGNGKHENVFGLELRYQPGMPLKAQLDPKYVRELRKMHESRHDLVERNNNIVLEYRKKQVISLSIAPEMTGISGETKTLVIGVRSKYGLDKITWDAVEFSESGGQITDNGRGSFSIRMPLWKNTQPEKNVYNLTATAIDVKGNVSASARLKITVKPATVSEVHSFITPGNIQSPADGKSVIAFSLTLLDERKNPVDLPENEIFNGLKILNERADSVSEADTGIRIESTERTGPGIYAIRVVAGKLPGKYLLSASVGEAVLKPAILILKAAIPGDLVVSLKLAGGQTELPADGKSVFSYKVKVTDSKNKPRKGMRLLTRVDKQGVAVSENVITDEDGQAVVQLKSGLKPVADITIYVGIDEQNMMAADKKVSFIADRKSAFISQLIVTSDNAPANGLTKDILNAYVQDKAGNHVAGAAVRFSAEKGLQINGRESENHVITDKNGVAKAELTSSKSGSFRITAEVEQSALHVQKETTVKFSEIKHPIYNAILTTDLYDIPADGVSSAHIRIEISDPEGKPAGGLEEKLTLRLKFQDSEPSMQKVIVTKISESAQGIYTAAISSASALKVNIVPEAQDIDLHVKPLSLNFISTSAEAEHSKISIDKVSYLLGNDVNVTVRLRNAINAPVRNAEKEIKESIYMMGTIKDDWTEKESGVYHASYKSSATGSYQVVKLKLKNWNEELKSEQYTVYGKPQVEDVRISGNGLAGIEHEAKLIGFNSNYTGEEDSLYQWEYQLVGTSSWTSPVSDSAKKKKWIPGKDYDGYNIRVCVIPKGKDQTITGSKKCSDSLTVYKEATVKSVDISGMAVAGETLHGLAQMETNKGQHVILNYQWYYRSGSAWVKIRSQDSQKPSFYLTRDYPGYDVKLVVTPHGSMSGIGNTSSSKELLVKNRTDSTKPNWMKPKMGLGCWWGKGDLVSWELPKNAPSDLKVKIYKEYKNSDHTWTRVFVEEVPATERSSSIYGTGSEYWYLIVMEDKYGNKSAETFGEVLSRPVIGNCSTKIRDNPSTSGTWIN